jgi:hypothetical protein
VVKHKLISPNPTMLTPQPFLASEVINGTSKAKACVYNWIISHQPHVDVFVDFSASKTWVEFSPIDKIIYL